MWMLCTPIPNIEGARVQPRVMKNENCINILVSTPIFIVVRCLQTSSNDLHFKAFKTALFRRPLCRCYGTPIPKVYKAWFAHASKGD